MEKTLRVGILGTGRMAGEMAHCMEKMQNIEAFAVASRSNGKAESFAKEFGIGKFYGTYEELYEDPDVDLIYIASPHSHHARYAMECIRHKKPCLVEKSFTANAAQARETLSAAEKAGVFVAEAIWTRYMPMVQMIRDAAFSGKIGEVCSVTANLGYAVSDRPRLTDPALAGGALLDVGVYCLTFISLLLGDDIRNIEACASLSDKGIDLHSQVLLTVRHHDRDLCCSFFSTIEGGTDRDGMIYGTRGYIRVGNVNNFQYLEIYDNSHRLIERVDAPAQTEHGYGYGYQFEACRRALSEGKKECAEMPHAETIKIMEIMDQIREKMGVIYPDDRPAFTAPDSGT